MEEFMDPFIHNAKLEVQKYQPRFPHWPTHVNFHLSHARKLQNNLARHVHILTYMCTHFVYTYKVYIYMWLDYTCTYTGIFQKCRYR